jgi:hypothetical protein
MPFYVLSQDTTKQIKKARSYFFYWGYHRNFYSPSDIHYKSEHYDFTLYDAKANDMPASIHQYFDLKNISVPQYNVRFGAEWKNNWFISIGVDHYNWRIYQSIISPILQRRLLDYNFRGIHGVVF